MTSRETILAAVPTTNRSVMLMRDQDVPAIMKAITHYHKKHAPQYDKIAGNFAAGTERQIAKGLFDFCKKNIEYCEQTEDVQSIRSPGRILSERAGDCKHYASFIAGVLDALKRSGYDLDWAYRFAKYENAMGKISNHVFVILYDGDGREIWIDPVLNWFDYHLPYKSAQTKSVDTSRVIGCVQCGGYMISGCGGTIGSKESDMLDALKQFELGLYDSYNKLIQNNQVDQGITTILQGAAASLVPGAAAAESFAKGLANQVSSTFGPGSTISRVITALTSSNVLTALPNALSAAFGSRTYNTQSYLAADDYFYHVKGVDRGASTNIADAEVPPALMWLTMKTGIFMPGRNFLAALRDSVDTYLGMISVNPRTTQDRVRVQLARDVMMRYMPNEAVLGDWAKTVGVYDNPVTAAVEKLRIQDINAQNDTKGVVPIPSAVVPTASSLVTSITSGGSLAPLLLIGGGLYFLSKR